jgi:hypothetical protein
LFETSDMIILSVYIEYELEGGRGRSGMGPVLVEGTVRKVIRQKKWRVFMRRQRVRREWGNGEVGGSEVARLRSGPQRGPVNKVQCPYWTLANSFWSSLSLSRSLSPFLSFLQIGTLKSFPPSKASRLKSQKVPLKFGGQLVTKSKHWT